MEPRQAEAFLKKPDAGIGGGVIHVGDDGLVPERAAFRLAESISSIPVGM